MKCDLAYLFLDCHPIEEEVDAPFDFRVETDRRLAFAGDRLSAKDTGCQTDSDQQCRRRRKYVLPMGLPLESDYPPSPIPPE
jgi:hypothetical protein